MDYRSLFKRAWDVLWEHKALVLLGLLAALSSSRGGSSSGGGIPWIASQLGEGEWSLPNLDPWSRLPDIRWGTSDVPMTPILIGVAVGVVALTIALALWAASTLGRGALIAAVQSVEGGEALDLRQSLARGWKRLGAMLLIGLVPAIPFVLLMVVLLAFAMAYAALDVSGFEAGFAMFAALGCLVVPVTLAFQLLRTAANRACMVQGLNAYDSILQGWAVLRQHAGPALLLWLLEVVASVFLGAATILPLMMAALCCIAWPVQLALQGIAAATFSTVWTLAWREWTGIEPAPAQA